MSPVAQLLEQGRSYCFCRLAAFLTETRGKRAKLSDHQQALTMGEMGARNLLWLHKDEQAAYTGGACLCSSATRFQMAEAKSSEFFSCQVTIYFGNKLLST